MNGYKIALLAVQALGALVTVGTVGKPRKPLGPGTAVATLVTSGILCLLVVLA